MSTVETIITFGVQYKHPDNPWFDERKVHPLGMHGDGYAVIEAPSRDVARAIAHAVLAPWAFDYDAATFFERERRQSFKEMYPYGELLRIAWVDDVSTGLERAVIRGLADRFGSSSSTAAWAADPDNRAQLWAEYILPMLDDIREER